MGIAQRQSHHVRWARILRPTARRVVCCGQSTSISISMHAQHNATHNSHNSRNAPSTTHNAPHRLPNNEAGVRSPCEASMHTATHRRGLRDAATATDRLTDRSTQGGGSGVASAPCVCCSRVSHELARRRNRNRAPLDCGHLLHLHMYMYMHMHLRHICTHATCGTALHGHVHIHARGLG